jgi:branched-chain amino acid transport system ATP-binding protein
VTVPLLELEAVSKRFGGVKALKRVTFVVEEAEILGIIGPNGAGKTTLLNCISGVHRIDEGQINFDGKQINGEPPHMVARLGIGRTFQIVKPFASMTVRENAAIGALFGSSRARMAPAAAFAWADEVLALVGLASKASFPVAGLTIPDRKRLELARAVATRPRLLLLDEVMSGLNAVESDQALDVVRRIHQSGITIVLIEHVMPVVAGVCERIVVLNFGEVLTEGRTQDVLDDSRVVEAYLGQKYAKRLRQARGEPDQDR